MADNVLPPSPPPGPGIALDPYSTIRCICGCTDNNRELIQCSDCHCYLHCECLDRSLRQGTQFRCPFCIVQLDGVDPFRDLVRWIDGIVGELKLLHGRVTEAGVVEAQMSAGRQGSVTPKGQLTRALQEVNNLVGQLASH